MQVTQSCTLSYRRFAIGCASDVMEPLDEFADRRNTIPRYSRPKVYVTLKRGVARTSARHAMPLQQRTNTITAAHSRATGCGHRYFTVDLSVFGAHLPRSP